jgi:glutaminyl-peptide cyclotransferase
VKGEALSEAHRAAYLTVCALSLALSACHRRAEPPTVRVSETAIPEFDGVAALKEVEDFVALGPRVSGTEGAEKAAWYILNHLMASGVAAEMDVFEDTTPQGMGTFRNVSGRIPGQGRGLVVLGSHYETKAGISEDFVGANDSGSSTGLLLELAQLLGRREKSYPFEIVFAFFDGEECLQRYGAEDGLHGSRRFARQLAGSRKADQVKAVIVVDMIGDSDLHIDLPRNSTRSLVALALDASRRCGRRASFGLMSGTILDDHVPFLEHGFPAIDLIDFQFGSGPGKNDYWHTDADSMDKLSAESLETVGMVLLEMLNRLGDSE